MASPVTPKNMMRSSLNLFSSTSNGLLCVATDEPDGLKNKPTAAGERVETSRSAVSHARPPSASLGRSHGAPDQATSDAQDSSVSSWTATDVSNWLDNNGLQRLHDWLTFCLQTEPNKERDRHSVSSCCQYISAGTKWRDSTYYLRKGVSRKSGNNISDGNRTEIL